jgi:hypothetical protein
VEGVARAVAISSPIVGAEVVGRGEGTQAAPKLIAMSVHRGALRNHIHRLGTQKGGEVGFRQGGGIRDAPHAGIKVPKDQQVVPRLNPAADVALQDREGVLHIIGGVNCGGLRAEVATHQVQGS